MRLGFAVAVHLDPEIVLVDEAFAVGDEAFQRKCLRKMRDFQDQGSTIVAGVARSALVEQTASRACLLRTGRLEAAGRPADVIGRYHELGAARAIGESAKRRRWGTREVEITDVELLPTGGVRAVPRPRASDDSPQLPGARSPWRGPCSAWPSIARTACTSPDRTPARADSRLRDVWARALWTTTSNSCRSCPGATTCRRRCTIRRLVTAYDHRDRFASLRSRRRQRRTVRADRASGTVELAGVPVGH